MEHRVCIIGTDTMERKDNTRKMTVFERFNPNITLDILLKKRPRGHFASPYR